MTNTKEQAMELIKQFSGQANVLVIPRPYITMTGSLEAALLLSQIIYWSDRSGAKDGWFAKTYGEWETELTLSQYQVTKAVKALKEFGVETKLKKFRDVPTLHYRVNQAVFLNRVMKFFDNPGNIKKLDNPLTEPTEPTKDSPTGVGSADPEPEAPQTENPSTVQAKPERPRNPMYDTIQDVWGLTAQRNGLMAGLLKGEATRKGWAEFNLEMAVTPEQVREWAAWYKRTNPGITIVSAPDKVQSSITYWLETQQKRAVHPTADKNDPNYDPRMDLSIATDFDPADNLKGWDFS